MAATFDLHSELRKGTEVSVTLPPKRVLATVAPLQPLGPERHRQAYPSADAPAAPPHGAAHHGRDCLLRRRRRAPHASA